MKAKNNEKELKLPWPLEHKWGVYVGRPKQGHPTVEQLSKYGLPCIGRVYKTRKQARRAAKQLEVERGWTYHAARYRGPNAKVMRGE
jgi:hypothetical protein